MRNLLLLIVVVSLFSCKNREKEGINQLVNEWSGREIVFPNTIHFTILGTDTNYLPQSQYKIISYYDSIGCTSCKLKLAQWKKIIIQLDSIGNTSVLLFAYPKDQKELAHILKREYFNYPFCVDEKDSLNKLNHFPSDITFQTFLLDIDNKVLAIGNPIHNLKVKELYLKIIRGEKVEQEKEYKAIKTKIDIDKTSFSLGVFGWQKEQSVTFILKNVGDKPLVIEDVNTSCGCTTVSYSKEPVQPEKELKLCDGENLVVYDFHSGDSYTLFDANSGNFITRFGTIGQGPTEIPSGCYGYLARKCFFVFDNQTQMVMKYSLDSLRDNKKNEAFMRLAKYNIQDAKNSRLVAVNDSTFLSAGTYKTQYQYLLFDKNSKILDYGIDIYNASDSAFNMFTKYLANQGDLVMHPQQKKFAYSINFSSNIDFFEIANGKIELIKSLRLGDPKYKPVAQQMGGNTFYSADLTEDSQVGYINLASTTKHVYALHSDKKIFESGGRKSNTVLVFDWEGNPVKKYSLDKEAYYIAVDEIKQRMFVAVKNSERGWSIISYSL